MKRHAIDQAFNVSPDDSFPEETPSLSDACFMKCTLDAYKIWPELGHLPWSTEDEKRQLPAPPTAPAPDARPAGWAPDAAAHPRPGARETRLWLALALGLAIGGVGTALAAWGTAQGASAVVYADAATITVEHAR